MQSGNSVRESGMMRCNVWHCECDIRKNYVYGFCWCEEVVGKGRRIESTAVESLDKILSRRF